MADNDYIAARADQAHERIDKLDVRVGALERDGAVTNERMSNIQTSLNEIKTGIRGVMWWAIGAVATPVAGAIVLFVLKGGLHV